MRVRFGLVVTGCPPTDGAAGTGAAGAAAGAIAISGTAGAASGIMPGAAGIACGGFDKAFYETREATPEHSGFALELENDWSCATLQFAGKPNAPFFGTIALSTIAALNRFVAPITF